MKGSYDVIERFKEVVKKYNVEDLVDLQASFCLGYCAQGVTVQADNFDKPTLERIGKDTIFLHNVNKDNVEEFFAKELFPLLNV